MKPSERSIPSQPQTIRMYQPRWRPWLSLASLPMVLLLVIPLVGLVLHLEPAEFMRALLSPAVSTAIRLSLLTSLATTLLTLLLGTPLAYLLARRQFRGRALLDTLLDLPMVLPPAVAGIALLVTFGRRGWLGAPLDNLGISLAFSTGAVILAQLFVAGPYYVKAAAAGFSAVERELEQAAAIDGASPLQVLGLVTLPLAWQSLLSGMVMTWARALGEFGATIIFAGNFPGRTQTMPLAIYLGFELDLSVALTLACILLACSFLVLGLVKYGLRSGQ